MVKKNHPGNIPPLRGEQGTWALTASEKADLLANTFEAKFHLPPSAKTEDHNSEQVNHGIFEHGFLLVRTRSVRKILSTLGENIGTGPDELPSIILKKCARELAYPITKLVRLLFYVKEYGQVHGNYTGCYHYSNGNHVVHNVITEAYI